jgi:hypothetical protein
MGRMGGRGGVRKKGDPVDPRFLFSLISFTSAFILGRRKANRVVEAYRIYSINASLLVFYI